MRTKLRFLLLYFVFWLLLFILGKIVFLFYQHNQSFQLSLSVWFGILRHGFRLDVSTAGYLTLIPLFVLTVTSFFNYKPAWYIINIYSALVIPIFLLITLVDLEIYKYWGVRFDSAPLRFLSTPGDTLASSSMITLVLYFSAFAILSVLVFLFYIHFIARYLKLSAKTGIPGLLVFSVLSAFMIIPIRGGTGVSAINTGSAFFHKNTFANHAAINVVWNFGHSVIEKKESFNPYVFFKTTDYDVRMRELFQSDGHGQKLFRIEKPNIVLIILESFSAKLIEPLGGAKGVTPEFNSLCKEGALFSNIFASDSRTDKGLASLLSGYPVLESIPVLQYPEKTQHMPFVSKDLNQIGYNASFMYGGDVDFANIRSYLVNGNFTKIISSGDFPSSQRTGKWGVPDHIVYRRFLAECKSDTGHWFRVMLSLSNHEPFEIPVKQKFGNKSLTDKFHSSAFYADSCLGEFVRQFKEAGLWDNSVIIMVADHGTRVPDYSAVYEPRKFHIPVLWTGGALVKDTVISKIGSQADLAVTLLHQFNLPTDKYILGKDLLSPSAKSFAFYSYKNGIAMITDSTGFGLDFNGNHFSFSYGPVTDTQVQLAKSLQQYVFDNYLRLSEQPYSK